MALHDDVGGFAGLPHGLGSSPETLDRQIAFQPIINGQIIPPN
jgi:hypothetical protein